MKACPLFTIDKLMSGSSLGDKVFFKDRGVLSSFALRVWHGLVSFPDRPPTRVTSGRLAITRAVLLDDPRVLVISFLEIRLPEYSTVHPSLQTLFGQPLSLCYALKCCFQLTNVSI